MEFSQKQQQLSWLERRIHIRQLADGSSILLPATKTKALNGAVVVNMPFTVYVLYSPKFNKIYIGYSSDLQSRLDRTHLKIL